MSQQRPHDNRRHQRRPLRDHDDPLDSLLRSGAPLPLLWALQQQQLLQLQLAAARDPEQTALLRRELDCRLRELSGAGHPQLVAHWSRQALPLHEVRRLTHALHLAQTQRAL